MTILFQNFMLSIFFKAAYLDKYDKYLVSNRKHMIYQLAYNSQLKKLQNPIYQHCYFVTF